jgi:hypothetical protein
MAEAEIFNRNYSDILYSPNNSIPPISSAHFINDDTHYFPNGFTNKGAEYPNKDFLLIIAYVLDLCLIFILAVIFKTNVNLRRNGNEDMPSIRFAKGPLRI